MKKMTVLVAALALVLAVGSLLAIYAGPGPAPNSGDGVSDGSGFDVLPGPAGDADPLGPNPSAGDGIPDGSELPAPNGPAAN